MYPFKKYLSNVYVRPQVIITEERSGKDVAYLLFANLLFDFLVPAFVFLMLLPGFLLPSKSRAVKLRYEQLHLFLQHYSDQKPLNLITLQQKPLSSAPLHSPRRPLQLAKAHSRHGGGCPGAQEHQEVLLIIRSQTVTSSTSTPPPTWSLFLSKLALPLAPAATSAIFLLQVVFVSYLIEIL